MSVWQTPHAASRTSTSPALGSARSTSWTARGRPNCSRTAARIFTRPPYRLVHALPDAPAAGEARDEVDPLREARARQEGAVEHVDDDGPLPDARATAR